MKEVYCPYIKEDEKRDFYTTDKVLIKRLTKVQSIIRVESFFLYTLLLTLVGGILMTTISFKIAFIILSIFSISFIICLCLNRIEERLYTKCIREYESSQEYYNQVQYEGSKIDLLYEEQATKLLDLYSILINRRINKKDKLIKLKTFLKENIND